MADDLERAKREAIAQTAREMQREEALAGKRQRTHEQCEREVKENIRRHEERQRRQ